MQLKTIPIGIVGIESNTVKAYLAIMKQNGLRPRSIIIMKSSLSSKARFISLFIGLKNTYALLNQRNLNKVNYLRGFQRRFQKTFDLNFDFFSDVDYKDCCETYYEVYASNINDSKVIQCLKASKENVVIYGGGGIVKDPVFELGIKIIHTHPGYLPFIRGSHGVFWSLLIRQRFGCSTFYMNNGIDLGQIIIRREYPVTLFPEINESVDIIEKLLNFYIDPLIRAKTLIDVLLHSSSFDTLSVNEQNSSEGESYYFMQDLMRKQVAKSLKDEVTCSKN